MKLVTESYLVQKERWPKAGRHILAHYDNEHIVVYQAFRPSIGHFAAKQGYFGGPDYSMSRMSWIKPNFLWMMYRCGWGTRPNQETILAIWLKRSAFDLILSRAVHSSFVPEVYGTEENWKQAVAKSTVRMQWGPDHDPSGNKLERRAIQLGLRGEILQQFAQGDWIIDIEDISDFVAGQKNNVHLPYTNLETPYENSYLVDDQNLKEKLQLSRHS